MARRKLNGAEKLKPDRLPDSPVKKAADAAIHSTETLIARLQRRKLTVVTNGARANLS